MRLTNNGGQSRQNTQPLRQSPANGSATTTPIKASSITNGSGESNGYTNGHSVKPTGPFFGHDREEVTRILIQSLTDLGYHGAAVSLSRESGYELENPSVAAFRNAIQEGEWQEAESLLFGTHTTRGARSSSDGSGSSLRDAAWLRTDADDPQPSGLPLAEGANKHEMLFRIRQQKYLELLEERDIGSALMVLRQELAPLRQDTARLHALSSMMMCQSATDLRELANWDGAAGESRTLLLSELSKSIAPSVMIPEHRLAVLLDQVQEHQVNDCLYHNSSTPPSLYYDHSCDREDFPLHTLLELHDHTDEVWYIDFSHDGSMLATASSDNSILVYDTTKWKLLYRFSDNHGIADLNGVCYVSWSPDDRYLLSCSRGNDLMVYDVKVGRRVSYIIRFEYTVTSAVWAPDGSSFVVSTHDSSKPLGLYNLSEQEPIYEWSNEDKSLRINDCSISADGRRLAVISNDRRILVYDFQTRVKIADWMMEDTLTCVNLSADGKSVLVSMNNSRLMLLDADTGDTIQRYLGLKQKHFVIRSRLGGAGENFVISGSEVWRASRFAGSASAWHGQFSGMAPD